VNKIGSGARAVLEVALVSETIGPGFALFWVGQAISALGSSMTAFVLPLITYDVTHSPLALALTTATTYLPYMLLGLPIGAWVDRIDRRRLMVAIDAARAAMIASIPVAFVYLHYPGTIWWIYVVAFTNSTLGIAFNAGRFAAVPALVNQPDALMAANGRLQATFSVASLAGPFIGGVFLAVVGARELLLADAVSFSLSAISLLLVGTSFNKARRDVNVSLLADVKSGLKFVWADPVLRNIAILAACVNFFLVNVNAQIVFLARSQLHATGAQIGWLYSAGSAGILVFSLLASRLRTLFPFGPVAIGALCGMGVLVVLLAMVHGVALALPLWAGIQGTVCLFSINTSTLRQSISPEHMLGRVSTVAAVLAWSIEPPAAVLGGYAVGWMGSVGSLYVTCGLGVLLAAAIFATGPVGHADSCTSRRPPDAAP